MDLKLAELLKDKVAVYSAGLDDAALLWVLVKNTFRELLRRHRVKLRSSQRQNVPKFFGGDHSPTIQTGPNRKAFLRLCTLEPAEQV